jgi:hypothetical protein
MIDSSESGNAETETAKPWPKVARAMPLSRLTQSILPREISVVSGTPD